VVPKDGSSEAHIPLSEVLFQPSNRPDESATATAKVPEPVGVQCGDNQPLQEPTGIQPSDTAVPPADSTNPFNHYTMRSGHRTVPSQQQRQDDLLALAVSWEVFHDGGYDIQNELLDPIAFLGVPDTTVTIRMKRWRWRWPRQAAQT
jgi:hypothetical protein